MRRWRSRSNRSPASLRARASRYRGRRSAAPTRKRRGARRAMVLRETASPPHPPDRSEEARQHRRRAGEIHGEELSWREPAVRTFTDVTVPNTLGGEGNMVPALSLHQFARRPGTLANSVRRCDDAVLRVGLVVLLDVVDVVLVVHHQAMRLREGLFRQVAEWIELLQPRAVAEMETRHRIERTAIAIARGEEVGRRRVQHRLLEALGRPILPPIRLVEF